MKVSKELTTLLGAGIIVIFYLVTGWLVIRDYSVYVSLIIETGPYEWIGAVSCLVAASLFLLAYVKYPEEIPIFSRLTKRNLFVLVLALGSLFLFLEEISWGQRIFGLETPKWLMEINEQKEINLHNVSGVHDQAHQIGISLLEIYFVVLPVLVHLSPLAGRFFRFIGLPVADLQIAFFMLISGVLNRNFYSVLVWRVGAQDYVNYGEVQEVVIEVILMIFAIKYFNHTRAGTHPSL